MNPNDRAWYDRLGIDVDGTGPSYVRPEDPIALDTDDDAVVESDRKESAA